MSSDKNQESQTPPLYPDINSSSSSSSSRHESFHGPSATPAEAEKWGTHVMGTPAVPTCHPSNQKAALWGVGDQKEYQNHHQPYVQYAPVDRNATFNSVLHKFNTWSSKAETTANNIWQHCMHPDLLLHFRIIIFFFPPTDAPYMSKVFSKSAFFVLCNILTTTQF